MPAVGERIGRHIHDADEDGVIEVEGATPAEGRERRAHRFRGVCSERGELHRTGLAGYDARSALTMLRRAARSAFFASMALNPNTPGSPAATRNLNQLTLECHAPAGSGGGLPSTGPRAAGVFSRAVPSAEGAAGAGGGGGTGGSGLPATTIS